MCRRYWTQLAGPRPGVEVLHAGDLRGHLSPALLAALSQVREEARERGSDLYVRQMGLTSSAEVAVVQEAGLGEAFVGDGYVPYLDCLRAIRGADGLLLLEAAEGNRVFLPSKIADYAVSGRPVLMWSPLGAPVAQVAGGFDHPGFMGQTEEGALRVLRAFMDDVREGRDMGRWALDASRFTAAEVAKGFLATVTEAIERGQ